VDVPQKRSIENRKDNKKMKLSRILYGIVGVILLAGTILTADRGLSADNKKIYEDALGLQADVDKIGFQDFKLEDYKVRFFNGSVDYVVSGDAIEKEDAVFTTFVGTTYEVDGEYQVILPTVENFSAMFDLLESAGSLAEGSMNFSEAEYGDTEHIATLWHEALHAYQMTYYEFQMLSLIGENLSQGNIEDIIVGSVDNNQDVVELYKKQIELLNKAYNAKDLTVKETFIAEYLELEQERRAMLDEGTCSVEDYYEAAEGTARYMESKVYSFQEGNEAFEETYMGRTEYEKGSAKYYSSGMIICYLLDDLDPDWKADYDFSVSLKELLKAM